jgi:hypothetical protein
MLPSLEYVLMPLFAVPSINIFRLGLKLMTLAEWDALSEGKKLQH